MAPFLSRIHLVLAGVYDRRTGACRADPQSGRRAVPWSSSGWSGKSRAASKTGSVQRESAANLAGCKRLADGLKLLTKEDLMPEGADGFLFKIAPYVSFCAAIAAFIAIPFAGGDNPWIGQRLNVGVFFVLAVLGLEVFGVILAGYSSASKWSLFGAMREAAQVVSYEVPLGMCVVVPVLMAGSMDLVVIGDSQAGWFTNWIIFHDPFTFIAVLGVLHLCDGECESGPLRSGGSRKRTGGRISYRILRSPLELFLHGRIRLDVLGEHLGGDSLSWRVARPDSDHQLPGLIAGEWSLDRISWAIHRGGQPDR